MDNIKLDPKELFGEDGIQFMPTDEIKGMLSYLQSVRATKKLKC